ncbi:MAG: trypsin-like peptidase domain-containing protein [Sulfuricellaceae bacterium]
MTQQHCVPRLLCLWGAAAFVVLFMSHAYALPGPQIYRLVKQVTARVKASDSQGSGVVVSPSLVVTNCHVVGGAKSVSVEVLGRSYPATVVEENREHDVCTLELRAEHRLQPIKGARLFNTLEVGERVYALGAPLDLEFSFTDGIIAQTRVFKGGKLIQFTAPIGNGSSGGGVFDTEGRLIGLSSFMISEKGSGQMQNANFAWSIDVFPARAKAAVLNSVQRIGNGAASTPAPITSPDTTRGVQINGQDQKDSVWAIAYQAKDYKSAITLARKRISDDPQLWLAWLRLAQSELLVNNLDKANSAIDRALQLNPNDDFSLYVKGVLLRKKSDPIGVQHVKLRLKRMNSEWAEKL